MSRKVSVTINGETVELIACSYKGVSFFFDDLPKSGGRSVISKAIPFSEEHINEDVGKVVQEHSVTLYLVGENVDEQRAALEKAFNEAGAGELILPNYGTFQARCKSYSFSYKKNELEYISGSASFVPESDSYLIARDVVDMKGVAKDAAQDALDESKASFSDSFSIVGKAKAIVDAVENGVDSVLEGIETARTSIRDLSEFVGEISKIRADISLILQSPKDFSARLQRLLTMTRETFGWDDGDPEDYVNESISVMTENSKEQDYSSPVAEELMLKIRRLALVSAASSCVRALMDVSFDSADDALVMQDKIESAFDSALEKCDDADEWNAMQNMRAAALKYLRDSMSKMAVVIDFPMNDSENLLTVCFDCYGDIEKFEDVLERNSIEDPSMLARQRIRVLSK